MEISFTPDQRAAYRAAAWHSPEAAARLGMIYFGFGGQHAELIVLPLHYGEEPANFNRFCDSWEPPSLAGNLGALWAGFMALRYSLGYFTQWELLSADLRLQARRCDPLLPPDPRSLIARIRQWTPGWEGQLEPLRWYVREACS